ncbi:hypothetical protein [Dickeya phage Coodle]|uniref:Uncharacterized protein n=17 Tax=Aglimvirinae TaxID=2169530 RepID=A0A3G2K9C1_9CAUD|nr:hypothetical protein [Dickeya phage Coodle]
MLQDLLVYTLPGVVVGFVAGALVFRKHAQDGEVIVQKGKDILEQIEAKLDELKKKVI